MEELPYHKNGLCWNVIMVIDVFYVQNCVGIERIRAELLSGDEIFMISVCPYMGV